MDGSTDMKAASTYPEQATEAIYSGGYVTGLLTAQYYPLPHAVNDAVSQGAISDCDNYSALPRAAQSEVTLSRVAHADRGALA